MQTTTPAAQATTAGHTPGPWTWDDNTLRPVKQDPAISHVHSILDAEGGFGFMGGDVHQTCAELEADRALIAAAPELLEALKLAAHCLQWHAAQHPAGMDCKAVEDARAAIAKATGQQGGAA